ncbi:MAG: hypothetical protein ACNA77_00350 [Opitutales bacterium]
MSLMHPVFTNFCATVPRCLRLACLLILLLPFTANAAAVRVIEAGAIPFSAFLSKADFDQRYPGEEVADLSKLKPGWYIIYEHESLSYYFGPVLLESTGRDYLVQLTETVEAAVAQRPSIQDYRLELSYEPSQSSASPSEANTDPQSENPSGSRGNPPPPPPSIWNFFRRLFGF